MFLVDFGHPSHPADFTIENRILIIIPDRETNVGDIYTPHISAYHIWCITWMFETKNKDPKLG